MCISVVNVDAEAVVAALAGSIVVVVVAVLDLFFVFDELFYFCSVIDRRFSLFCS